MTWYEPVEVAPRLFEFEDNRNSNNNDDDEHGSEESDFQFEERGNNRRRKRRSTGASGEDQEKSDELQRRIESLLSPILMSVPSYEQNNNNDGILNDLNDVDNQKTHRCHDFSKYPHPSFPCREKVQILDSRLFSSSSPDYYFFYPRFDNQSSPPDHTESHTIDNGGISIEKNQDSEVSTRKIPILTSSFRESPERLEDPKQPTNNFSSLGIEDGEESFLYSETMPTTQLSPTHYPRAHQNQTKLAQDPITGQLIAEQTDTSSQRHMNQQDWAGITNIGTYHPIYDDNMNGNRKKKSTNKKKEKKAKKDKKKKNKRQKTTIISQMNSPQTTSYFSSTQSAFANNELLSNNLTDNGHCKNLTNIVPSPNIQSNNNENNTKISNKPKRIPKTKNQTQRSKHSNEPFRNHTNTQPKQLQKSTFVQLGHIYGFKNAGISEEALNAFYLLVEQCQTVAWSIIFYDDECTSPFVTSCKKYCTPKGPPCTHWNCTCDNQVRAMQASAPLLGAIFVMYDTTPSSQLSHDDEKFDTFILPLGRALNDMDEKEALGAEFERIINWPIIPINCGATMEQRWDTFRKILMDEHIHCITYNATVGLMPYHYHCANDIQNISIKCRSTPRHIWDLKLASWMLSPHAPEETLEFDHKCDGFAHLKPKQSQPLPDTSDDDNSQLLGIINVQHKLQFLMVIYPFVNQSLKMQDLISSFHDIESPVLSLLSAMECNGIRLKSDGLLHANTRMTEEIDTLTQEARLLTKNNTLLLSSSKQIQQLLYDVMQIQIPSTISLKQPRSAAEDVLVAIQEEAEKINEGQRHKIIDIILEFRKKNKMLTGFIRPLPNFSRMAIVNKSDNNNSGNSRRSKKIKKKSFRSTIMKIHPMWMQTSVRTGRLSCRKPNMQQIPNSGELKNEVRSAFVPSSKHCCFVSCDYSQNEVRILAHVSNDRTLISLFQDKNDVDIYKQMASLVTGQNVDEISKEQRSMFKQVTLAILYGMGVSQVAQKLCIQKRAAQKLIHAFYARFLRVKQWINETKNFAKSHKYVKTICGRKRYLDDIDSSDSMKRSQAERQAVNTVIQGSAADLIKLAMLKMASRIVDWKSECQGNNDKNIAPKMLLQIHDELLFETVKSMSEVKRLHSAIMRCCGEECVEELQLKVPLKLTCMVGDNWGKMEDIDTVFDTLG